MGGGKDKGEGGREEGKEKREGWNGGPDWGRKGKVGLIPRAMVSLSSTSICRDQNGTDDSSPKKYEKAVIITTGNKESL